MPVQSLLLASALFFMYDVSIASELPAPEVVTEKDKSVDSTLVKPSPHAKLRGKPTAAPATIYLPIEKTTVSAPVPQESATKK